MRAAFLFCFALFCVAVLLATAWFGLNAQRRNPPYRLNPAKPPDGRLVFPIRPLLEEVTHRASGGVQTAQVDFLASCFTRSGEILYWNTDTEAGWLMFLPLARPNRLYRRHITDVLGAVPAVAPRGQDAPQALAYYELRPEGVLLAPSLTFPDFQIVKAPKRQAAEFRYDAPKGYLPRPWRRALAAAGRTVPEDQSMTLRWSAPATDTSPTLVLTVASPDGPAEHSVPWFHPFWQSREAQRP